jgi:2-hydroxychromene-2-carboxylate isomerase
MAYLLSFARGVNAEGILSETDAGLERIVTRAGLDWDQARTWLEKDDWKARVETNRQELLGLGLWGVPCFRYGELIVWGQDRIIRIEQAIQAELAQ